MKIQKVIRIGDSAPEIHPERAHEDHRREIEKGRQNREYRLIFFQRNAIFVREKVRDGKNRGKDMGQKAGKRPHVITFVRKRREKTAKYQTSHRNGNGERVFHKV